MLRVLLQRCCELGCMEEQMAKKQLVLCCVAADRVLCDFAIG